MRGLVTLLLIPSLVAVSSAGPSLHTHVSSGHTHPEHHHQGLAAHQHVATASHDHDGASRVQECSPAAHAVEFALVSVAPAQEHGIVATQVADGALERDAGGPGLVRRVDLRAHAPPLRALASPRGPPSDLA